MTDSKRTDRKGANSKPRRRTGASLTVAADHGQSAATLAVLRQSVGDVPAPTRASVLRDLEAAKHLAFELANIAGAVRATELQGKSAAAFDEPVKENLDLITDQELCDGLANGNAALSDALMTLLAKGTLGPGLALGTDDSKA